jgi:CRISPR-associated protein Cmr1
LFAGESAIWGGNEEQSRVSVRVEQGCAAPDALASGWHIDANDRVVLDDPAYVLFLISDKERKEEADAYRRRGEQPRKRLLKQHSFRVLISSERLTDAEWSGVELSARAWILFGGVGARTRRGLGSLRWKNAPAAWLRDAANQTASAFGSALKGLPQLPEGAHRDWPILPGAHLFVGHDLAEKPAIALRNAVLHYAAFRQQRSDGRRGKGRGRSQWPEPEAIRNAVAGGARAAQPWHGAITPADPAAFPRSLLGLPIITHFIDATNGGDPEDTTLGLGSGKEIGRLASPLLVKPLVLAEGSRALFLLLNYNVASRIEPLLTLSWRKGACSMKVALGPCRDPLQISAPRGAGQLTLRRWIEQKCSRGVQL